MSLKAIAPTVFCGLSLTVATAGPQPGTRPATAPATQGVRGPATLTSRTSGRVSMSGFTYSAIQKHGQVAVIVRGSNPTAGYETRLVQARTATAGPPEFVLIRRKPTNPVAQVISGFQATATFKSEMPVKMVFVRDDAGRHEVPVEQQQD